MLSISKDWFMKTLPACAIIFLMIGAAMFLNNTEIILPEVSALAIGSLVYQNPAWLARPFYLFLLPSLTAIGGFLINQLAIDQAAKLIMVLALVILVLTIFKSALAPAFATGLLPVITHAGSMMFVYSVVVLTLLLYACIRFFYKYLPTTELVKSPGRQHRWLYFAFLSVWILVCRAKGCMMMAAIPPVVVVGYESMHKDTYPVGVLGKQIICLVAAALLGTASLYLFKNLLLATLVDFVAITALFSIVRFKLTPAYAMSLLPMVLPGTSHAYFSLWVLLMCIVIFGFVWVYKNISFSAVLPQAEAN
ncbi:hypothetical protein [Mucilaginibacter sp. CSA2-8R]|uniref:hypothetical protein n=1 Tax=Mucilaginibacter sp. CSA2-8R TaxID=3141542 RepID=UPI00315C6023